MGSWPTCEIPEAPDQCLGSEGQAQHPCGSDTAAPGSAGTGQWQLRARQRPLSRNNQAAGKALFSTLVLCPWRACTAQPPAECTWGRRTTSNNFGLPEETFGLCPGKWGLQFGQPKSAQGGGNSRRPGRSQPWGSRTLPGPACTLAVGGGWRCPPHADSTFHTVRLSSLDVTAEAPAPAP